VTKEEKQGAMAAFLQRNWRALTAFARRKLADAAERDGEDIVQDVVLGILERADVMAPIENFSAFVYRSIRNRVVDELRRHRTDVVPLESADDGEDGPSLLDLIPTEHASEESAAEREELFARLYRAIDRLPEAQRQVIVMTELEGRAFRELAVEWGVPIGTLLARKSRGIKAIRELLNETGEEKHHA
jgi:RNA polymerase sigma-70 factor (ECF subfamily)